MMLRAILYGSASRVTIALVNLALLPLTIIAVGVGDFGLWLIVISAAGLLAFDVGLGVAALPGLTRSIGGQSAHVAGAAAPLLRLFGGYAAALAAATWAAASALAASDVISTRSAVLVGLAVTVNAGASLALAPFRLVMVASQRTPLLNLMSVVIALLRAALLGVLIVLDGDLVHLVAIDLGATAAGGVAPAVWYLRARRRAPAASVDGARGALRRVFYWPQTVVALSGLAILQTDNLILGAVLGPAAVTAYAGGLRIYLLSRELLASALLPGIARWPLIGPGGRAQTWLRWTRTSLLGAVALAGAGALAAEDLLAMLGGGLFDDAVVPLQVLMIGLVVNSLHIPALAALADAPELKAFARLHVAWAVSNVGLGLLLAPHIGIVAVAVGTSLPCLVLEPFYLRTAARALGVPPRTVAAVLLGPGSAALVAFSVVWISGSVFNEIRLPLAALWLLVGALAAYRQGRRA